MYRIIGGDGREYGPVSTEQLRDWLAQGRISAQTRVRAETGSEWKAAGEISELAALFARAAQDEAGPGPPPVISRPRPGPAKPAKGLAVASFVLGLCSFALCLSVFTGLPAIICGHVARSRARRAPDRYGGRGLAAVGLLLGYAGIVLTFVIAAMLLPVIARNNRMRMNPMAFQQPNDCRRHLREVGLAFKIWALDHNDQYPFNVSTNSGGTRELCAAGPDGFDRNALVHFQIISNELSTPAFLVCPKDAGKRAAEDFEKLTEANVSYRLRTGTNINADNPQEVMAVCPIHGYELFCDGNVRPAPKGRR